MWCRWQSIACLSFKEKQIHSPKSNMEPICTEVLNVKVEVTVSSKFRALSPLSRRRSLHAIHSYVSRALYQLPLVQGVTTNIAAILKWLSWFEAGVWRDAASARHTHARRSRRFRPPRRISYALLRILYASSPYNETACQFAAMDKNPM